MTEDEVVSGCGRLTKTKVVVLMLEVVGEAIGCHSDEMEGTYLPTFRSLEAWVEGAANSCHLRLPRTFSLLQSHLPRLD